MYDQYLIILSEVDHTPALSSAPNASIGLNVISDGPERSGRVLFTDESRFKFREADGRVRMYRHRGERFQDLFWW